jgi:hypothetical protein
VSKRAQGAHWHHSGISPGVKPDRRAKSGFGTVPKSGREGSTDRFPIDVLDADPATAAIKNETPPVRIGGASKQIHQTPVEGPVP